MKTYLFTFVFTFCLMLPFMGVAQKHLHNGFVAATNNGVYYLQDGFNEWVSLGQINVTGTAKKDYDTITSISFFKDRLSFTTFGEKIMTNNNDAFLFGDLYGYKNSEGMVQSQSDNLLLYYKFLTNKLKNNNLAYFYKYFDLIDVFKRLTFYTISNPDISEFTSVATDNDSIMVWTGTDNILYKTIISDIVGNRSNTAVSGLASNTLSSHQICYDSGNDVFYIASDEGFIYTYNKTTVVKLDTINSNYEMDSVVSLSFSPVDSILYVGIFASGVNNMITVYYDSENYGLQNSFDLGTPTQNIQSTINKDGEVLFNQDTLFVLFSKANSGYVDNLPSGTVVYDLDYIDYLPYVSTWDYEGTVTVGFTSSEGYNYYGYDNEFLSFGSIAPTAPISFIFYVDGNLVLGAIVGIVEKIEINGVEYTPIDNEGGEWIVNGITNPFPPVGEPCTIKLKYTLQ